MSPNTALIIIDVQDGFDSPSWGRRDNPEAEENIASLLAAWHEREAPVVIVQHASPKPLSPLNPNRPGYRLKAVVRDSASDLHVVKSVNSAFHGQPDLHGWLQRRGIDRLVLCGIQTNMCVETTARLAGNLGYGVTVAIDACHTFDLAGPDGTMTAAELTRATVTNLVGGGFAGIAATTALVRAGAPV